MTLSEAIRQRAENSGMTPEQALAYRVGALDARLIIATATATALAPAPTKGK